jgi:hypothetical protein
VDQTEVGREYYAPGCAPALFAAARREPLAYNRLMERKIFWTVFILLGLVADFVLPLWWGIAATVPIVFIAWWVAYRSEWF